MEAGSEEASLTDGWVDGWIGWMDGDGWKDESVDIEMSDQRVCRVGKVTNA